MADVLRHIVETPAATPSSQWSPDTGVSGRRSKRFRSGKCPIDNEIQTIVLRCLTKERERRYESAGGLLRDLERYVAGEPIEAKRDSAWYVLRKLVSRHAIASAALAAVLVTIVSFGAISFELYRRTRDALHDKNASDALVLSKSRELEAAVDASALPAVRRMALGWFLAAWRTDQLDRAKEIRDRTTPESPEHIGMTFLLDEGYTIERLFQKLRPDSVSLAHFVAGERHRKQGRNEQAIEAFEACLSTPGEVSLQSSARATLRQLRREQSATTARGAKP
jgi:hypothetical protein